MDTVLVTLIIALLRPAVRPANEQWLRRTPPTLSLESDMGLGISEVERLGRWPDELSHNLTGT